MTIFKGSRYQVCRVYSGYDSNGVGHPTLTARNIPEGLLNIASSTGQYKTYIWKDSDRVDLVARREWGDGRLWWAILDANPQYLLPFDIQTGDVVIIPPYEQIRGALGNG